jgi:hypothetical protein
VATIVSAVAATAVLVFGGGWVWDQIAKPKLVYRTLPTYKVGTQNFSGVVVENRGPEAAHGMRVKIADLGATIQELSVESEETPTTEDGGKGTGRLTLWLDRFLGGSAMTIYMITDQPVLLGSKMSIIAEEGRGVPVSEGSEAPPVYFVALGASILAVVASVVTNLVSYMLQRRRPT